MIFRLAIKNILHAGLRTWLNISALMLVFIMILFMQGMYSGMFNQIEHNMVEYEVAGGQYWLNDYDSNNPLKIDDFHADLDVFKTDISKKKALPILYRSGALYGENGMRGILIKGIDRDQTLLNVPTNALRHDTEVLSAYIGKITADQANLSKGDIVLLRFRDNHGVNNAVEVSIDSIMHLPLQSIDVGQIWVDLESLQELCGLENHASIVVVEDELSIASEAWEYQGMDVMFADLLAWRAQELTGAYMMLAIFLGLAVLAIFDTQILSIFKRKKEIGTLVAIGMRQQDVVGLFTLEGVMIGLAAMVAGSAIGIPLVLYFQQHGINFGSMESLGMNIMNVVYTDFSMGILWKVSIAVFIIVTLVSFLAAKRIAKMNVVQVLKGK
ncbi:MAG: FtsX-like permease family protein [Candidatus Marinimicrobia bacterium]|nr:FtsX-like permease family protein [Candidatus Neomarinimicrobiota bacterium]